MFQKPPNPLILSTSITVINTSTTLQQADAWAVELNVLYDQYFGSTMPRWTWDHIHNLDRDAFLELEEVIRASKYPPINAALLTRFQTDEWRKRLEIQQRLFIGVYPCGLVYADRSREENGDYVKLAFLPYDTLELDLKSACPEDLGSHIKSDALHMQSMRGQKYRISSTGQTVTLGSKVKA